MFLLVISTIFKIIIRNSLKGTLKIIENIICIINLLFCECFNFKLNKTQFQ